MHHAKAVAHMVLMGQQYPVLKIEGLDGVQDLLKSGKDPLHPVIIRHVDVIYPVMQAAYQVVCDVAVLSTLEQKIQRSNPQFQVVSRKMRQHLGAMVRLLMRMTRRIDWVAPEGKMAWWKQWVVHWWSAASEPSNRALERLQAMWIRWAHQHHRVNAWDRFLWLLGHHQEEVVAVFKGYHVFLHHIIDGRKLLMYFPEDNPVIETSTVIFARQVKRLLASSVFESHSRDLSYVNAYIRSHWGILEDLIVCYRMHVRMKRDDNPESEALSPVTHDVLSTLCMVIRHDVCPTQSLLVWTKHMKRILQKAVTGHLSKQDIVRGLEGVMQGMQDMESVPDAVKDTLHKKGSLWFAALDKFVASESPMQFLRDQADEEVNRDKEDENMWHGFF